MSKAVMVVRLGERGIYAASPRDHSSAVDGFMQCVIEWLVIFSSTAGGVLIFDQHANAQQIGPAGPRPELTAGPQPPLEWLAQRFPRAAAQRRARVFPRLIVPVLPVAHEVVDFPLQHRLRFDRAGG